MQCGIIDWVCEGSVENLLVGMVDEQFTMADKLKALAEKLPRLRLHKDESGNRRESSDATLRPNLVRINGRYFDQIAAPGSCGRIGHVVAPRLARYKPATPCLDGGAVGNAGDATLGQRDSRRAIATVVGTAVHGRAPDSDSAAERLKRN